MKTNNKVADSLDEEFYEYAQENLPYGFDKDFERHIAVAIYLNLSILEMLEIESDYNVILFSYKGKDYRVVDRKYLETSFNRSVLKEALDLIPEHLKMYFDVQCYLDDVKSGLDEHISGMGAVEVSVEGTVWYVIPQ